MVCGSNELHITEKMGKRAWSALESFQAKRLMKNLVKPFLETRGYTQVEETIRASDAGETKIISCYDASGNWIRIRVRSCWRCGSLSAG